MDLQSPRYAFLAAFVHLAQPQRSRNFHPLDLLHDDGGWRAEWPHGPPVKVDFFAACQLVRTASCIAVNKQGFPFGLDPRTVPKLLP